MRVALASCRDLPGWEVDDEPLERALAERGIDAARVPWDEHGVDWSAFDGCLLRTTWDYQERRDEFVAWARSVERVTALFNPAQVVAWNTHKSYLRELERRGAALIPTVWIAREEVFDVEARLAEYGWRRAFLKPAVGATARATLRFDADSTGLTRAAEHLERMRGEDMLLQPYVASVEDEGELSAILIEGRVTHAVRKVPVPGDYRVQDDFGARDEPAELEPGMRAEAERLVASLDLDLLYARVDLLQDGDGRWCLNELELVEPSLFFRHRPRAAALLADGLLRRLRARDA